ncbi:hypothetical protein OSTOST_19741 [Ostertagia ostertagi]
MDALEDIQHSLSDKSQSMQPPLLLRECISNWQSQSGESPATCPECRGEIGNAAQDLLIDSVLSVVSAMLSM